MFSLIDAFALVTSSLSRFWTPVTRSPCDDFIVWRLHPVTTSLLWRVRRVTSSLCDEFTCNRKNNHSGIYTEIFQCPAYKANYDISITYW